MLMTRSCKLQSTQRTQRLQRLRDCAERVRAWFIVNHLMLNAEKSDVFLTGIPQALKKNAIKSISLINIAGTDLKPLLSVLNY